MMNNVYSVYQVNSYIKNMFSQDFMLRSIYVKGEASNVKYHSSGHIYFTMKDQSGTLACVMFAGSRAGLKFVMQEGQQIVVFGSIEVYERDGKYQLYAREIKLDGAGDLYVRFEQLKRELEEMGMFDPSYKKPLPKYAGKIGVVTAATGAAVRDIMNIAARRNPYVQLILYPAQVQGEGAAASIVNGIRTLEALGVDVIIIGRGGGSIEDLWAFNEEIVARAVFACSVPIVSAVGHETDTTISDYVADFRAPTPSAAAELTVFSYQDFSERLAAFRFSLSQEMSGRLKQERNRLNTMLMRVSAFRPEARIREQRMNYVNLFEALQGQIQHLLQRDRHRLQLKIEQLKALSPLDRLQGGFVYATANGKPLTGIEQAGVGEHLMLRLSDGRIGAKITEVTEDRLPT